MTNTDPRYTVIAAWENAHKALQAAKDAEAAARQHLIDVCYPAHQPGAELEGTHNVELSNGFALKGKFGTSYTINREVLPEVHRQLEQMGEAGEQASETLFRYKPELNVAPYKLLLPSVRKVVDQAITSKPSLPSFEIVQVKRGKAA